MLIKKIKLLLFSFAVFICVGVMAMKRSPSAPPESSRLPSGPFLPDIITGKVRKARPQSATSKRHEKKRQKKQALSVSPEVYVEQRERPLSAPPTVERRERPRRLPPIGAEKELTSTSEFIYPDPLTEALVILKRELLKLAETLVPKSEAGD